MRVGGNERGGWKGMLDIFTPRRLRGGVKIRGGEFLGGGEVPNIIGNTPPPATASRSHPPRKRRRVKKILPFPRRRESPDSLTVFWHRIPKQLE